MKSHAPNVSPRRPIDCVIGAALMIVLFSSVLRAQPQAQTAAMAATVFDKDVFENWGQWPQGPDRLPYYEEPVFAYRAYMDDVERVPGTPPPQNCPPLPDALIIPPGTYEFRGLAFSLQKEGLYRLLEVAEEQQQRIVYRDDVHALLSGIAWIVSHGRTQNGQSREQLAAKAKSGKVFLTCGSISGWTIAVLAEHEIRARSVTSLTLENWNDYDNGHALLEVYRKDLGKWVLYDVDANSFFTWRGTPLSLVEFAYAVMSDLPYEIQPLALDAPLDVSGFRSRDGKADYALMAERVYGASRQWYRRIMQVPMIGGYFFDDENRQRIEGYSQSLKYMDKREFQRTFYGEALGGK